MTIPTDTLNEEYTIDTPENVSIGYSVAGIGNRFIAALIDSALLGGALIMAQILLVVVLAIWRGPTVFFDDESADWRQGLVVAIYALASFALFWGYFILFEWLWHGQTPGKRVSSIRVVRLDGSPPRFLDIAVRNLVRIIDFLPFGYGIGLVSMFFNRQSRRLGDLAAGVIVVKDRSELRLEHVTGAAASPVRLAPSPAPGPDASPATVPTAPAGADPAGEDPQARFPAIRRLRVADYELMQESLRRYDGGTLESGLLIRLAQAMAQKAGGDSLLSSAGFPTSPTMGPTTGYDSRRLLAQLMDAYQRAHQA